MAKTLVEQYVEDPTHMRLFQQERAIYEVTELIESVMGEEGMTRAELARKLGKTKGWVTQLLDGEANKTIRTVADVLAVLGREYRSSQRPIHIGSRTESSASRTTTELRVFHTGDDYKPNTESESSPLEVVIQAQYG
jgi:transcriptional regulator with XRE-family HTH domain